MKCYYDILEISRDADDNEIKTAYRKLALKWHPDKNIDNTDIAKEQFQLVQQAYEVLSDKHERAWYDNHWEQILRGSDSNYQDDYLDVYPYFTTQCFSGYGDDPKGFYAVYRGVFEQIAKEDIEYLDSKSDYDDIPKFGDSTSDYEEVVKPFYSYWSGYTTKKSYVWLDPYNINETRNRRVSKLIEKENKKIRQNAKKERNEEVRNLVAFVRKRDKRVQAYAKLLEAKNLENRKKQEEIRKQKILERKREIEKDTVQAEWAKFDNVQLELKQIEKQLAAEFGENLSNSEDETADECMSLYCVACNKVFKNPKAFSNHESSKKHKENVEKLQVIMKEEDANHDFEQNTTDIEDIDDAEVEEKIKPSSGTKKKNKKNRKVIKIQESHAGEDDVLIKDDKLKDLSDSESTFNNSKKQKKKQSKSTKEKSQSKSNEEEVSEVQKNGINLPQESKNLIETTEKIESIDLSHCCATCKSNFSSKNKLFEHLKKTNHSVYLSKAEKQSKSKKKQAK